MVSRIKLTQSLEPSPKQKSYTADKLFKSPKQVDGAYLYYDAGVLIQLQLNENCGLLLK